jgi:hypothetical protein
MYTLAGFYLTIHSFNLLGGRRRQYHYIDHTSGLPHLRSGYEQCSHVNSLVCDFCMVAVNSMMKMMTNETIKKYVF